MQSSRNIRRFLVYRSDPNRDSKASSLDGGFYIPTSKRSSSRLDSLNHEASKQWLVVLGVAALPVKISIAHELFA